MCGIVGFFSKDNSKISNSLIEKMTQTLNHRGPDYSNFFHEEKFNLFLGHARLSIIDLNISGHQPLISNSGRYVLIYNGEIYNYLEIKDKLNNNFDIKWRGTSDTEVLLNSLELNGINKTLELIKGMYSFCLFDKKKSELILARDVMGEKPLYYGYSNNNFYFASELKAIAADNRFNKVINKMSLDYLMKLNYIPSPFSIYRDLNKIKPGHYVKINMNEDMFNNEKVNQISYHEFSKNNYSSYEKDKGKFIESKKELEQILYNNIEDQMKADVDVGAFLSSGIDSSLTTSIMTKISSKKINTFTLGYNEKYFDESEDSKLIANHLNTKHHVVKFDSKEAISIVPNLSDIYCEPFSDSSQIPYYYLCNFAKNYNKVIISGDGGDELFFGYNRYIHNANLNDLFVNKNNLKSRLLSILSRFNKSTVSKLIESIESIMPAHFRINNFMQKIETLNEALKKDNYFEFYLHLNTHWSEGTVTSSTNNNSFLRSEWDETSDFLNNCLNFDLRFYLPDDLLVKSDRASMANSLEIRNPYLSKDIVEYSKKLPINFKLRNNEGKYILKSILYDHVPKKIFNKKKKGFLVPLKDWLQTDLRDWGESLLNKEILNSHDFFDNELIFKEWNNLQKNKSINYYKL